MRLSTVVSCLVTFTHSLLVNNKQLDYELEISMR